MFAFENVRSTYVGADRACRCGCKGTYAVPQTPAEYATAKRRWKQLMHQHTMFPFDASEPFGDEVHLNYTYGNNRALTVYFRS
jgi:hypothetical protein